METWQQVLMAVGGNAALLAVLGWLGKSFLSQLLAKDLDKFKSQLQMESASAAERLKHDLQLAASEHSTQFAKLHEKRADVIAESHRLVRNVHLRALQLSLFLPKDLGDKPDADAFKGVADASGDLQQYLYEHGLYLPEALCDKLNQFAETVESYARRFMRIGGQPLWGIVGKPIEEVLELRAEWEKEHGVSWKETQEFLDDGVPQLKRELERELRRLMGDRESA